MIAATVVVSGFCENPLVNAVYNYGCFIFFVEIRCLILYY